MKSDHQYSPVVSDKVHTGQKIAWATGAMADTLMANIIAGLALPIYNIALGVSPVLIGYALGIPRFWDAFTDPFMGNLSDNTHCKWGRRRPYIALGAILSGVLFAVLWMPPTKLGQMGLFIFFLVASLLYFTAYTIYIIPQNALGFEMSADYNERTRIMAYRSFFAGVGGLLLPWAYKLCFLKQFGNNEVQGVRIVGIIFGVIIIITGIIPAIFCRENIKVQTQAKISLLDAFKYTIKNGTFLILALAIFFILVGLFLVAPLGSYINIFYVYGGDKSSAATIGGIGGTIYAGMSILMIPAVTYLGTHWSKKKTLLVGQFLVIVSSLSSWFLYTPEYPYLQLLMLVMTAPGLCCIFILTSSMLADVCDIDELTTGRRREGMYGAVFSWVFKGGIAAVMALSGYLVNWSGFDAKLEAIQASQTIFNMRLMFAVVPAASVGISFLLTVFLPLTKKRAMEVRIILDKRKKEILERHAPDIPLEAKKLAQGIPSEGKKFPRGKT